MAKKIVEFKNISKSFESTQVLKNVSLDIDENEFVTLLGPSGCGKTTLLRILGGFETADSGEVLFDGEDIKDVPPHKRDLNTIFQRYALFPHLNVFDNVAFGLKIKKVAKPEIKERVNKALATVGLADYGERYMLTNGQSGYTSPDFKKITEAYGIKAMTIDDYHKLSEAKAWFSDDEPCLINIMLPDDTLLLPKMNWNEKEMKPDIEESAIDKVLEILRGS